MSRAKGIIHIEVSERSEFLRELRVVLFLLFVKAQVFEQEDAGGRHHAYGIRGLRANAVLNKEHLAAQDVRHSPGNRGERKRFLASLWPPKM